MDQQLRQCTLCDSDLLTERRGYESAHLVQCGSCGFTFCARVPTQDELHSHYARYPRGVALSPITLKRYRELLERLEPFRQTGRLLDIGCGDGHFLEVARQMGWTVFGSEFSPEAIDLCAAKGITMHKGSLQADSFPAGYFDVITSMEVLEHVPDPRRERAVAESLVRKGGLYYVTTPNFNALSRLLLGPKWNVIEYPEHLGYHTRTSLRRLFGAPAFQLQWISSTGFSIDRFRRSKGHADGPSRDEQLREGMETSAGLGLVKKVINFLLDRTGTGDGLKAMFIKN